MVIISSDLEQVNNRNTRTMCEICSKLKVKTPEKRQRCSSVFIANFEQISLVILVILSSTLNN